MKTKLASVLASLALAGTGFAQSQYIVEKAANYVQIDATGAQSGANFGISPYEFRTEASSAATVTPPGLSAITVPSSQDGGYHLELYFATKAALDAAYPNGTYQLNPTGSSALSIPLNGDLYPSTLPQVIGGTWRNNVLVVNAAQGATLNFNPFTGYSATGNGQTGSHMSFEISTNGIGPDQTTDLQQQYITASVQGLTQSATPFTSYTIAPNALQVGNLYQATLDYDPVTYFSSSGALVVGIYESQTTFYISAQGATPPPNLPTITTQPTNVTAPLGSTATFTIATNPSFSSFNNGGGGGSSTIFSWLVNGQSINIGSNSGKYSGDQNFSLTVHNIANSDVGTYQLEIESVAGIVYSQTVSLAIGAAAAPAITGQPGNQTATAGNNFTFGVSASGVGPFAYQWYLNGVAISGATGQTYSSSASAQKAGAYTVTVTNSGGTVTSNGATLTVNAAPSAPNFTTNPQGQTITAGSTVVFNVVATGNPTPTLQWQYNGAPLSNGSGVSGASTARLVITNTTTTSSGNYSCVATNSQGQKLSGVAQLAVNPAGNNPGRLVNLSILSQINGALTMGFVNGGTGTSGSEPFLIRAVGPLVGPGTLFNVPGVMPDPTLKVLQQAGGAVKAQNSGWGSNSAAIIAADSATGAFPLTNTSSLDSAVVVTLPSVSGGYGAQVQGASNDNGYALTEVYDNTAIYTLASPRLVNLSCLTNIAAGGTLNVGFVVGGNSNRTFLVRVSGPSIAVAPFNVPGTMPDPQLSVAAQNASSFILASNAGWGGDTSIASIATSLGAFAFTSPTSKDSAVLLTVPPMGGGYSVTVSSVSNAGGAVLVEVYEVP